MVVRRGPRSLVGSGALMMYQYRLAQASVANDAEMWTSSQSGGSLSRYIMPFPGRVIGLIPGPEDGFDGGLRLEKNGGSTGMSVDPITRSGATITPGPEAMAGFIDASDANVAFDAGDQIGWAIQNLTTAADIAIQMYVVLFVSDTVA